MQSSTASEEIQSSEIQLSTELLEYLDALAPAFISDTFDGRTHVRDLGAFLERVRTSMSNKDWRRVIGTMRSHDSFKYLHQDPFTRRSLTKPRGYSGDAVMMDYIYQHHSIANDAQQCSPIGRKIFDYTTASPASSAVYERRNLLARTIDDVLLPLKGEGRILAIACGHLRELDLSRAAQSGLIREMVGVDQDSETINALRRRDYGEWVHPICGSVQDILAGRIDLGSYDLIYTAGLLDYLPNSLCVRLLARLKSMLADNGTLLVANFLEGIVDRGYMESCMDWWLIYRSEEEMATLGVKAGLAPNVSIDSGRQIAYLRHSAP